MPADPSGDNLDYIASLAPADYPPQIRIGCDSSFFQTTDPSGKTAAEVHPKWPAPPTGRSYLWDDDGRPDMFRSTQNEMVCGNGWPAYTQSTMGDINNRVIFCPEFWQQAPSGGLLGDFKARITTGTSDLSLFTWMGSRMYCSSVHLAE
jgi:hypothetical protein